MSLFEQLVQETKFFLIAGPCVVEDESLMLKVAEILKEETSKRNLPFVFKSSYRKANRTSVTSYSGPGMDEGLRILEKIKREFSVPIITDIHESNEVAAAAEVADILQIPAFLSRQTYLLQEAALSGKIVNIKKGQFMAPEDMKSAIDKVLKMDNFQIMVTERGSCFGYHDLIVDFRSFAALKEMRFPVIYDVTHSLQRPSLHNVSGGSPEYAGMMARAAMATRMVDGLFIETHPEPMEAMSDAASMLALHLLPSLLDDCLRIAELNLLRQ